MRKLFQYLLLCLTLALTALSGGAAFAATTANGYFTYDPAKEGMRDLREMLPIEGCNVPGGLVRITDRDEPGSAAYWCGPPPHCLAEGTHPVDSCRYVPFCRREPRGNPNGIPGANGCRDPEDLICVSSGEHPEGGLCLKTCWDGSRIPFSQLCPPRCWEESDADGNTYEVCVQEDEIPDDPPPKKDPDPTCPDGTPVPSNGKCETNKKPCPGGTIPYEACEFTWGNTPHGGSAYVNSSNGVPGVLQAQCNNGTWENITASCDPVCPSGEIPLPDGTCPPVTCPDGSPVPANGVCPQGCEGQQVTWNVGSNYCYGYFPASQETAAHYVNNSNPAYTGQANFSCRGGSPALEWGTCDVVDPCIANPAACQPPTPEYCPDGSLKPANGVCPPKKCDAQQVTWSANGNVCSGYFPESVDTQAHYVTNTTAGFTGQAAVSCKAGSAFVENGTCDAPQPRIPSDIVITEICVASVGGIDAGGAPARPGCGPVSPPFVYKFKVTGVDGNNVAIGHYEPQGFEVSVMERTGRAATDCNMFGSTFSVMIFGNPHESYGVIEGSTTWQINHGVCVLISGA